MKYRVIDRLKGSVIIIKADNLMDCHNKARREFYDDGSHKVKAMALVMQSISLNVLSGELSGKMTNLA